jgi:hypothetical protein
MDSLIRLFGRGQFQITHAPRSVAAFPRLFTFQYSLVIRAN